MEVTVPCGSRTIADMSTERLFVCLGTGSIFRCFTKVIYKQKHSTELERFQSHQGLSPLHFGTAAYFKFIRERILSQNSLDLELPSSENDSQNPSSDKVIPSQGCIQTSYLAHRRGKVVSYSETNPGFNTGLKSQLYHLLAL